MTPITEMTEVYAGTLPAADGPGIDYVLTLNAATDGIDTTYTLDMTYLDAEGQGKKQNLHFERKTADCTQSREQETCYRR